MRSEVRSWARGAVWTTASSVIIGVLGLLAVTAAARGLGTDDFGEFAYAWAAFFGIGGVFAGLQAEVTRTASAHRHDRSGPALVLVVAALSVPVAVLGSLVVGLGEGGRWQPRAGVPTFAGLIMLACLTVVAGILAAELRWGGLAGLMTVDAVIRTAAVVLVTAAGAAWGLPAAIASGSLAWLLVLTVPQVGSSLRAIAVSRPGGLTRRLALAMAAAGCTSLVVSGLPALVGLLRPEPFDAAVAALLAALVLIRSGLLLVVYGARPVILRYFLATPPRGVVLRRALAGSLLCGGAYAALMWLAGPWVLRLLLGPDFLVTPEDAGWLGVGAAGLAMMVMLGLALLALDRHVAAMTGWVVGLVSVIALLTWAPTAEAAVLVAAAGSPWIGAAVHLVLVRGVAGSRPTPAG
jgi:O-antigen/teichoic acid export membrane protein